MTDSIDPQAAQEVIYTPEEILKKLAAELPHWVYEDGWIRRKYKTSGWKATLMVVNTVGHLAEAAWHHPDLTVSYAFVIVKLCTHSAKGITNQDFELAAKIESVVSWQPAKEAAAQGRSSSLQGTPNDDPRFKYIKYDD
jgi:4a-hydroxytetrahydrobiopterin dehydratase